MKKILGIKKKYFFDIKNNLKNLEARCNYSSLSRLNVGDEIEFQYQQEVCVKIIKDIRIYHSIEDMLNKENITSLLPGVNSLRDALKIYSSIYSEMKVKKNGGMIVFELV